MLRNQLMLIKFLLFLKACTKSLSCSDEIPAERVSLQSGPHMFNTVKKSSKKNIFIVNFSFWTKSGPKWVLTVEIFKRFY